YQAALIIIGARRHGVGVLPVDMNYSVWDNILGGEFEVNPHKLRLGSRQVKGLKEENIEKLMQRRHKHYKRVDELADVLSVFTLERLADADAFRSIGLDRRQALWEVAAIQDRQVALFKGQDTASPQEKQIRLPFMSESEHVVQDYATTGLSIKAHPVSF